VGGALLPIGLAAFVLTRGSGTRTVTVAPAPPVGSFAPPTQVAAGSGRTHPGIAKKSRDEFLGAKLSQIVGCTDDRVLMSRDRYLSWVNAKRGPTGREKHISYGLYAVSFSDACDAALRGAATTEPALPELDAAASSYAATTKKLVAVIEEAHSYYEDQDYKDDAMAKGRALHPALMSGFASYVQNLSVLLAQLMPVADALITREIAAARAAQDMRLYWGRKSFQTALAMVRTADAMNPRRIKTLNLPAFSRALDQLIAEVRELANSDSGHRLQPYRSGIRGLVKHAKGLRRMAAAGKNFRGYDRRRLGGSAGWMTDNSPDRIRYEFSSLLRLQRMLFPGERVVAFQTAAGAALMASHASPTGTQRTPSPGSSGNAQPARAPAPTGKVLSVAEAKRVLQPMVLACMRTHKVHSIQLRLGNKTVGPVHLLGRPHRSRVDGMRSEIIGSKLGRCINKAGRKVRARAFKSNYILFNLVNSDVPNPLAKLPAKAAPADVQATIDGAAPKIHACARKHGEEGASGVFYFTIDGPTGNVISVRSSYGSKAFGRCAEKVYGALHFTRVQQARHKHTSRMRL